MNTMSASLSPTDVLAMMSSLSNRAKQMATSPLVQRIESGVNGENLLVPHGLPIYSCRLEEGDHAKHGIGLLTMGQQSHTSHS